jgi:hypothetical protein
MDDALWPIAVYVRNIDPDQADLAVPDCDEGEGDPEEQDEEVDSDEEQDGAAPGQPIQAWLTRDSYGITVEQLREFTWGTGTFLGIRTASESLDISSLSSGISALLGLSVVSQTLLGYEGIGIQGLLASRVGNSFHRRTNLDDLLAALDRATEPGWRLAFSRRLGPFLSLIELLCPRAVSDREATGEVDLRSLFVMDFTMFSGEQSSVLWVDLPQAPWHGGAFQTILDSFRSANVDREPALQCTRLPPVLMVKAHGPMPCVMNLLGTRYELSSFVERHGERHQRPRFSASIRISGNHWYVLDQFAELEGNVTVHSGETIVRNIQLAFYLRRDPETDMMVGSPVQWIDETPPDGPRRGRWECTGRAALHALIPDPPTEDDLNQMRRIGRDYTIRPISIQDEPAYVEDR